MNTLNLYYKRLTISYMFIIGPNPDLKSVDILCFSCCKLIPLIKSQTKHESILLTSVVSYSSDPKSSIVVQKHYTYHTVALDDMLIQYHEHTTYCSDPSISMSWDSLNQVQIILTLH